MDTHSTNMFVLSLGCTPSPPPLSPPPRVLTRALHDYMNIIALHDRDYCPILILSSSSFLFPSSLVTHTQMNRCPSSP